ncbi:MAG: ATP-dependent DNA helicase [Candidatus Pacebacteria bacterium]|nr:ATP-dependent DNA helicase [Candidatus Paceibacterota bacterium]
MNSEITLKKYFGYDSFRSNQKDIVTSVIEGKDTLVIMPTGGGKSLCYQVPGLILPGVTIVISPLISLMQDQVEALQKRNIKATYINSSLTKEDLNNRLNNLSQYKFIYIAPERLQTKNWLDSSKDLIISLIAIDEAHCISQWGHDFRPPYLQISLYVKLIEERCTRPIVVALTATATPETKEEIITSLQLKQPNIFLGSFTRKNLNLIIKHYPSYFEKELALFKILNQHLGQSGIIYTQTRKQSNYLSQIINFYYPKQNCHSYHAGLDSENRANIQTKFVSDEINLITATNAFGMGVDKANVRFVIHFGTPGSIENYYQEVGRAGRDNKTSWCYLLYHKDDLKINQQLLQQTSNDTQQKVKLLKLEKMMGLIHDKQCLTQTLNSYFTDEKKTNQKKTINNCQCNICVPFEITFTKIQIEKIKKLIIQRSKISKEKKLNQNQIMTDQVIAYISLLTPKTKNDLLKVPGIGQGWVDEWSDVIIPSI